MQNILFGLLVVVRFIGLVEIVWCSIGDGLVIYLIGVVVKFVGVGWEVCNIKIKLGFVYKNFYVS